MFPPWFDSRSKTVFLTMFSILHWEICWFVIENLLIVISNRTINLQCVSFSVILFCAQTSSRRVVWPKLIFASLSYRICIHYDPQRMHTSPYMNYSMHPLMHSGSLWYFLSNFLMSEFWISLINSSKLRADLEPLKPCPGNCLWLMMAHVFG